MSRRNTFFPLCLSLFFSQNTNTQTYCSLHKHMRKHQKTQNTPLAFRSPGENSCNICLFQQLQLSWETWGTKKTDAQRRPVVLYDSRSVSHLCQNQSRRSDKDGNYVFLYMSGFSALLWPVVHKTLPTWWKLSVTVSKQSKLFTFHYVKDTVVYTQNTWMKK